MIEGPAAEPMAEQLKPPFATGTVTMIGAVIKAGKMNAVGTVGVASTGNTTTGVAAVPLAGRGAVTTQTMVDPVLMKAANADVSLWGDRTATAACWVAATDSAAVGPEALKAMVCDMA